ncbi:MAG: 16S rRNA (adenine(1518)-N(6)/adenine(1519)-N(6))-dimethyltransferase RsmA [Tepidisphaerales bacterium]
MPQTKEQITGLLASVGTHPKHRFGQNFMIDGNLVRRIAAAGELSPSDLVVEVGPGTGTLTEVLLESGAEVLAVEIDRQLAELLRQRVPGGGTGPGAGDNGARAGRLRLIEGDVLTGKHALHPELAGAVAAARAAGRPVKLVANLPYNVASPLVVELLLAGVERLVFTVQKEVAERLRARAGEEAYGPLSVTCQMLARVEVLRTLPPQVFWPSPKVDSAVVVLVREDRLGGEARGFAGFVQQLFGQRRKMLRKSLQMWTARPEEVLAPLGIDPAGRCEVLAPEQLWRLYRALHGAGA